MITTIVISGVTLFLMMLALWLISIRTGNATIVDFGWGMGYAIVAIIAFVNADGALLRKILLTSMIVLWGGRLALYLLFDRVLTGKPEDGRYTEIRAKWKTGINRKFFFFFQTQAALILILSIPFMIVMMNGDAELAPFELAGIALWVVELAGEAIADRQLTKFKDNPANKGKTCRAGLWNYSRHPNYFFEWVIWVSYFVFALASPYGWIAVVSPLLMLYILLNVTGIPLTERQALRSRGDDYREYQRTTSPFIPWFRKK